MRENPCLCPRAGSTETLSVLLNTKIIDPAKPELMGLF